MSASFSVRVCTFNEVLDIPKKSDEAPIQIPPPQKSFA